MHFDADQLGGAQRFLLLGLRIARAADDNECAANIVGMLAYIAAHTDQPTDAVRLATAGADLTRGASRTTRARAAGRLATAHAAAGDLYGFRREAERARSLLEHRHDDDRPAFLYYLTTDQLNAETGQALVDLAAQSSARRGPLLREATELLRPLALTDQCTSYQRSALLHGCYLATAELIQGNHEQAVAAARAAIMRLPAVRSGRCRGHLRVLRRAFAVRGRSPWIASFAPELDQALLTL